MKSYAPKMDPIYRGLLSRAGCKGLKVDLKDKTLTALTSTENVMTWALFETDEVLSSAIPLISRDVSTLHVLTNVPLTAASGKKIVAKELMVWEGAYCYYCVGSATVGQHGHVGIHGPTGLIEGGEEEVDRLQPAAAHTDDEAEEKGVAPKATAAVAAAFSAAAKAPRRRYIAYDGPILAADLHLPDSRNPKRGGAAAGEGWNINFLEILASTVLQLVAAAVFTERILVLPVIYHDGRYIRTWEMLDMISAEQFVEVNKNKLETEHVTCFNSLFLCAICARSQLRIPPSCDVCPVEGGFVPSQPAASRIRGRHGCARAA